MTYQFDVYTEIFNKATNQTIVATYTIPLNRNRAVKEGVMVPLKHKYPNSYIRIHHIEDIT